MARAPSPSIYILHAEKEKIPGIKILPMTAGDLDEVLAIERQSFPIPWTRAQFERELENPVSFTYTVRARRDGGERLAAYTVFWVVYGEAHILNIAVHPELRRMGLATWLLGKILDEMRGKRAFEVFLEVRRSNRAAINLYKKFGFREAFERKKYYGDEDAIVMALDL